MDFASREKQSPLRTCSSLGLQQLVKNGWQGPGESEHEFRCYGLHSYSVPKLHSFSLLVSPNSEALSSHPRCTTSALACTISARSLQFSNSPCDPLQSILLAVTRWLVSCSEFFSGFSFHTCFVVGKPLLQMKYHPKAQSYTAAEEWLRNRAPRVPSTPWAPSLELLGVGMKNH